MKRRTFLKNSAIAGAVPLLSPGLSWAAQSGGADKNILVCVFLGGGADGLNIIAPVGEGNYYDLRPTLAVKEPGSGVDASLDLDGFFAMHPAMDKLHQRFQSGDLAVVQATGLTSDSHSHFDSQSFMQRGITSQQSISDGWLNRHLSLLADSDPVFSAVGLANALPLSLAGNYPAIAMRSIEDYGLNAGELVGPVLENALSALYNRDSILDVEARKSLASMRELRKADPARFEVENGAIYPDTSFGQRFRQLGQMIRADVGLTTASMEIHGWDHHDNELQVLPDVLTELSNTLDAFATDMGTAMSRITVVTMTEFGRRVYENSSAGTDHGHGSFMLAMGGGVLGGKVYGDWPGLAAEQLVYTGDLDITTDYRTVLAELLSKRFGQNDFETVFPDWSPQAELGMFT
ncbi:MAG: DUF1501 domain-containing protein [Xanthomonadales bacterium]|nr:DUF1501 domain-containing protein [Xanthomonadales bacterium]